VYAALRLPRRVVAQLAAAAGRRRADLPAPGVRSCCGSGRRWDWKTKAARRSCWSAGPLHAWHTLERLIAVPAQSLAPATFMNAASLPRWSQWVGRCRPSLCARVAGAGAAICSSDIVGGRGAAAAVDFDLSRSSDALAFPRYTLLAGPAFSAGSGPDPRGDRPLEHAVRRSQSPGRRATPGVIARAGVERRTGSRSRRWRQLQCSRAIRWLVTRAVRDRRAPQVYLYVCTISAR